KSLPSRKETTETAQKPQTEPKSRARKTQEKKPVATSKKTTAPQKEEPAQKQASAQEPREKKKPAPKPKPQKKIGEIFFSSLPPMADIYKDGEKIGKANTGTVKLSPGKHTLTFKRGGKTASKTVDLRSGKNSSVMVILK
ncbi:MAG: PEGA domain-containing protein, partial [Fibrobacterota bacterium]